MYTRIPEQNYYSTDNSASNNLSGDRMFEAGKWALGGLVLQKLLNPKVKIPISYLPFGVAGVYGLAALTEAAAARQPSPTVSTDNIKRVELPEQSVSLQGILR